MKHRRFDRRWAIPMATAVPVLACVYAFLLGPAPSKRIATFEASTASGDALLEPLAAGGSELIPHLLVALQRPAMPHRLEAIDFLARVDAPGVVPALEGWVAAEAEDAAVRERALKTLATLDPARARLVAAGLARRGDALGEAARRLL
jgi:hypothetical protein